MPAGIDVEFLGVEAQRRCHPHESLHEIARALHLADDRQRRHQPERADHERTLLAGEAVVGLIRAVAQDEPVLGQLVRDRDYGCPQPGVIARKKAEERRQQDRRIERFRVVVLAEHASLVDPALEDVGPDLGRDLRPAR